MLKFVRPLQKVTQPEIPGTVQAAIPATAAVFDDADSSAGIDLASDHEQTTFTEAAAANFAFVDPTNIETTSSETFLLTYSNTIDLPFTNEDNNTTPVDSVEGAPIEPLSCNDLTDIALWPSKLDDNIRAILVKNGPHVVQHLEYEFKETVRTGTKLKGDSRKLSKNWFYRTLPNGEQILRTWMDYSPSKESLFCFCCKLFEASNSNFASKDGFKNWWKLNPKLPDHERSIAHIEAFTRWKELEIRLAQGKTIDQMEQQLFEKETKKWREILYRLLDIIRFLVKQNLPLRRHRETIEENAEANGRNFLEMVKLISKYDPVLCEHVLRITFGKPCTVSYLSPKIQNEFISCLADQVRKKYKLSM